MGKNDAKTSEQEIMALSAKAAEAPESIVRLVLERFRQKLLDDPEWREGWTKGVLWDD